MPMLTGRENHESTYRLDMSADRMGEARTIEFGASGAEAVLIQAERHCRGRVVQLSVGKRQLGSIQLTDAGFWVLGAFVEPAPAGGT